MPYIKPETRTVPNKIVTDIQEWMNTKEVTMGDLNYFMTRVLLNYLEKNGENYSNMNNLVGMLESVKAEFQRRVVAPYEDVKIEENGDVEEYIKDTRLL